MTDKTRMSNALARLSVGAALLGLGGLFGAALTAGSDSAPAPAAAVSPERQPVEVRTVVRRRTVHVYRRPKHRRRAVATATAVPAPAPVAPAPALAPAPVRVSQPLVTRTSGSGRSHEDGEDRGEHEGREHEGGDD